MSRRFDFSFETLISSIYLKCQKGVHFGLFKTLLLKKDDFPFVSNIFSKNGSSSFSSEARAQMLFELHFLMTYLDMFVG